MQDQSGRTALHWTVFFGLKPLVRFFLGLPREKMNLELRDGCGYTVKELALIKNFKILAREIVYVINGGDIEDVIGGDDEEEEAAPDPQPEAEKTPKKRGRKRKGEGDGQKAEPRKRGRKPGTTQPGGTGRKRGRPRKADAAKGKEKETETVNTNGNEKLDKGKEKVTERQHTEQGGEKEMVVEETVSRGTGGVEETDETMMEGAAAGGFNMLDG